MILSFTELSGCSWVKASCYVAGFQSGCKCVRKSMQVEEITRLLPAYGWSVVDLNQHWRGEKKEFAKQNM